MTVTVAWYMTLAAVLFVIGGTGLLLRRNALVMFMSIELMLNSVNLSFVAAGRALGNLDGQIASLFVNELIARMKEHDIDVDIDEAVIDKLASDGFDYIIDFFERLDREEDG